MKNVTTLIIASLIAFASIAHAEDGSERFGQMLERVNGQHQQVQQPVE